MTKNHYVRSCIALLLALIATVSSVFAKSGPITVCYMDSNVSNLESAGKYTLASTGENVFDIAIIFAANVNYNTSTKKAVLGLNETVKEELPRAKNLQQKGIKVLLSILGNHQGAGVCNFPTYDAAYDFAKQCKSVVDQYGLDGIDIDDEYAKYGTNGTGQPNAYSFVYFVTALRELMPNKIISLYYIGPAASQQSYNGVTVGSKINYSWQAYYGSYNAPNVPGLGKSQLGPAAVWINNTSTTTAANNAQRTVNDGYGVYLTYNLPDSDQSAYISSFTEKLYESRAVFGDGGNDDNNTLQAATMTSPANGSTLTGSSATFQWTATTGHYWIDVGSSVGAYDMFRSGDLSSTSYTFNNLPTDGRTLYIRLCTDVNGNWQVNNYTYKAKSNNTQVKAEMISPANGSTLTGSSATFQWTATTGHYWIDVGSSVGAYDIFRSGDLSSTSYTFNNLPTDGRTLYIRLCTDVNGAWQVNNYTYKAKSNSGGQVAPTVNVTKTTSSSISLSWNNTGAQSYYIYTLAPGGSWKLAVEGLTSTSYTLSGLKADTSYTIDVYAHYGSTQIPKRITAKTAADEGSTLTNVAKGKPFAVSSIWGAGYEGWRANDGSTETRWASGRTGGNRWIYFDLQKTYNIQAVTLKWDPAYGSNYTIDVWNGYAWQTIKSVYNNRSLTNNITGLSSNAQYIRMNCSSAPYTHISLWEFEVYGK